MNVLYALEPPPPEFSKQGTTVNTSLPTVLCITCYIIQCTNLTVTHQFPVFPLQLCRDPASHGMKGLVIVTVCMTIAVVC